MALIITIKLRKFKGRCIKLDSESNSPQVTKYTSLYYLSYMLDFPWLRQ
jgi:hypothetical protein